jgi:hypothetical protein
MAIEVWLDGPRGGTGAAPDIIKGQMGMHMEYAIPICHEKLMDAGLRDHVVFLGSGGIRTWADIIKGVTLGLDGVVLGTADLVAIGCVRDRNCESGCRSGISTVNPKMQLLRDVELNTRQIVNFRAALQGQVARAIAGLGMKDIRQLRGRYQYLEWHRWKRGSKCDITVPFFHPLRSRANDAHPKSLYPRFHPLPIAVGSDCPNRSTRAVMDLMLIVWQTGMDGVGIWKGVYRHLNHYAFIGKIFNRMSRQNTLPVISGSILKDPQGEEDFTSMKMMKEIVESISRPWMDEYDGDLNDDPLPARVGEEDDFRLFG